MVLKMPIVVGKREEFEEIMAKKPKFDKNPWIQEFQ